MKKDKDAILFLSIILSMAILAISVMTWGIVQEVKDSQQYHTIVLDNRDWVCTAENGVKLGGFLAHPPECTQWTRRKP